VGKLPPDGFFMRLDFEPGNSLYLAARTTVDLDALLLSLADRGIETVARR